jgi:flagellar basal body-associated protein FliL
VKKFYRNLPLTIIVILAIFLVGMEAWVKWSCHKEIVSWEEQSRKRQEEKELKIAMEEVENFLENDECETFETKLN